MLPCIFIMDYVIVKARRTKGKIKKDKKYKVIRQDWDNANSIMPYDCGDLLNFDCQRTDCITCWASYPINSIVEVASFKKKDFIGYYCKAYFAKVFNRNLPKWW